MRPDRGVDLQSRIVELATPEDASETQLPRCGTHAGQPFGEDEDLELFEERLQRLRRKCGFERRHPVQSSAS